MKPKKYFEEFFNSSKRLHYKFSLFTSLFFLSPLFGLILFGNKFRLYHDDYFLLMVVCLLAFSSMGFFLLHRLFEASVEKFGASSAGTEEGGSEEGVDKNAEEISAMVESLERRCRRHSRLIDRKSASISNLKEFSDNCYVTFDSEEILFAALERALILTNADVGSILILQEPGRKTFVVAESIGGGEYVKKGDLVDFEASIAKYAVINKAPLLVEDIEKDRRFGRKNRSQYGSKSFICMPIKTSNNIIGVLTISRKKSEESFTQEDVETLTLLLSNAAFTYENLNCIKEIERKNIRLKSIEKVLRIMGSSYQGSELLQAILAEIRESIPYDLAAVMTLNDFRANHVSVVGLLSKKPAKISVSDSYEIKGSIMDRALKQDGLVLVGKSDNFSNDIEEEIFVEQGCESCVFAPMKMNGKTKGILAVGAKDSALLNESYDYIEWMPKIISLAIERNNLSAAVLQRNQELDTIRQIGIALASSTFDIKQVLSYTMDMIRLLMNVEAGSLYLLKGDELEFAAAFNVEAAFQKKLRLKLGQGVAGVVASRGESIIVNDVQGSPHFFVEKDCHIDFNIRSTLCVPIISQGKVIGVIEVLNKINGDFVVKDEELLQSIGASVSIALENAALYTETTSMAEQERAIRSMFQKYVPKQALDQIIHGAQNGMGMMEELKILTLLNIDIRNFSGLARRLGPQKTVFLLNQFFSTMGGIVFEHNGIVDKYLGDGFLAIFGAPVSSTKDADNALAAALEMQRAVSSLNDHFVKEFGASVNIGISLHTGEVVVGSIGFDMKMDYTVIGDSVNDVFRLQELTKPINNGILISENTSRAARARLDLIEIDPSTYCDTSLSDMRIYEFLGFNHDFENLPAGCSTRPEQLLE